MHHFTWIDLLSGPRDALESVHLGDQTVSFFYSCLVGLLLILAAVVARMGLESARAKGGTAQYVPDAGLSVRNLLEVYTEGIYNLSSSVFNNHRSEARKYFWLLGGLFIYVLANNLFGMLPGMVPPTDNMQNNYAMAITVLLTFTAAGLSANGFGFIKHLFGPVWWLAILIFPVEVLGTFLVRPFSLSLRLAGNMFGDHMVYGIMSGLVPLLLPVIFLALGAFVCFIQALVFTLLSNVYIAIAVAHEEH